MTPRLLPIAGALALWAAGAFAQDAPRFSSERQADTQGVGPRRLAVDVALLSAGAPFRVTQRGTRVMAEGGLADLRLFDAAGRSVPYLLVQSRDEPVWRSGRILPVAQTKTTSGFEVDFGTAQSIDVVRIDRLPAPFLKRLTLEGSGDRARWTMLQPEGTLFDLPDERISKADLAFTAGPYRYVRVTWNDASSGRVPLPGRVIAREARGLPAVTESSAEVVFERRPSEPGRSRYHIRLPAARLPIVALDLDVGPSYVHRVAAVSESRFTGDEAGPVALGSAALVRVLRAGITAESLRIPLTPPSEPEIDLTVEDGDNPQLDLRKVRVVFAELPWIYFEAVSPSVVARYGDRSAHAPRYDLEAARDSIDLAKTIEARWAAARAVSAPPPSDPGSLAVSAGAALEGEFAYARPIGLPAGAAGLMVLPLDAAALSHSRGPSSRFADVRIADAGNRQIPYLLERRDEPIAVDLTLHRESSSAVPLPAAAGGSRSVYRLVLPEPGLPPGTLTFETTAGVFQRAVQLGVVRPPDRSRRDAWFDALSTTTWRRGESPESRPRLSLPAPTVDGKELWLVIDEGDNAPLPLSGARLFLPSYRLRFFAPGGATLRILYGRDDLHPPRYDLSLLAPRVMGAAATDVTAGPESARAERGAFISPRWFWVLLSASVLVLLGLIVRLARRAGPEP